MKKPAKNKVSDAASGEMDDKKKPLTSGNTLRLLYVGMSTHWPLGDVMIWSWWLNASLQYLKWISNGDTAVLL